MSEKACPTCPPDGLKVCSKCGEGKPLTEFGFNAANLTQGVRDGKNIRCKVCVRAGVTAHRLRLKEIKLVRRRLVNPGQSEPPRRKPNIPWRRRALSRPEMVIGTIKEAIENGHYTRDAIAEYVKLHIGSQHAGLSVMDEVMEVIAKLTLEQRELTVKRINGEAFFKLRRIA